MIHLINKANFELVMPRSFAKDKAAFTASYRAMSFYPKGADGSYLAERSMSSRHGEQSVEKPKRRRHRPNAAQKERERQRVFREAFATLREHLPLESSKKIPKRDILRLAAQYIKYLTNLLDQPGMRNIMEGAI